MSLLLTTYAAAPGTYNVDFVKDLGAQLPHLTYLQCSGFVYFPSSSFKNLPRGLQHLEFTATGGDLYRTVASPFRPVTRPPTLDFPQDTEMLASHIKDLPSGLVKLLIHLIKANGDPFLWTLDMLRSLPTKCLRTLAFEKMSNDMKWTAEMIQSLGREIDRLRITKGIFPDSAISSLPPYLRRLQLAHSTVTDELTGACFKFLPRSLTFLSLSSLGTFVPMDVRDLPRGCIFTFRNYDTLTEHQIRLHLHPSTIPNTMASSYAPIWKHELTNPLQDPHPCIVDADFYP